MFINPTANILSIAKLVFRISMPGIRLYAFMEAKDISLNKHRDKLEEKKTN